MNNLINKLFKSQLFHSILFILTLGLGTAIIAIPLFRTTALPGPDSPYYLYHTEKFLSHDPNYSLPKDRSFVMKTFAFISKVLKLPPIAAIKIGVILIYLLAGTTTYLISILLFNSVYVSLLSMFITYFSSVLLRLSRDLYANLYGTVFLYILIYLLLLNTKNSWSKWWQTLIFFLTWGILFRLHGLVSIASFITVGIPFFMSFIYTTRNRNDQKLKSHILPLIIGILIFFTSGGPILRNSYLHIYQGVILPRFNQNYAQQNKKVSAWTANKKKVRFKDLPLHKQMFKNFYSHNVIMLSILGLITLISNLYFKANKKTKRLDIALFILFSLLLFLLTQQPLFGFNWLSDRFVLSMYGVMSIISAYGLWQMILTLNQHFNQTYIKIVLTTALVILSFKSYVTRAIAFSRYSFRPTLSKQELQFLKKISDYIPNKQYPVISTSLRHYWTQALNPDIKFVPAEYYAICNDKNQMYRFAKDAWNRGQAFGTKDAETSLSILKQLLGNNYYVILHVKDRCVNESNFLNNEYYTIVYQKDGFYILQRK